MGETELAPRTPAVYDAELHGEALYNVIVTSGMELGRFTDCDKDIFANVGRIARFEHDLGSHLQDVTIELMPDESGEGVIIFARRRDLADD